MMRVPVLNVLGFYQERCLLAVYSLVSTCFTFKAALLFNTETVMQKMQKLVIQSVIVWQSGTFPFLPILKCRVNENRCVATKKRVSRLFLKRSR